MFEIKFDAREIEAKAKEFGAVADQLPFIMSLTLNTAARKTKDALVQETWPQHVTVRNKSFIKRALQIDPSTKTNLRVEIFDSLRRANLWLHTFGGSKSARRGNLAIPPQGSKPRDTRGASGVRKSLRPGALIASTPKRALRITSRGIFIGAGGRLNLMYAFRRTAAQPADVPFEEDFEERMRYEVRGWLLTAVMRAMSTRRAR